MARKQRFRDDEDAAIDMTPMLDIVFIMLIFFIVTTSFVKEAGIEVLKPKASANNMQQSKGNIFIAIKENGDIHMDKRQVDVERIGANIESLLAEQPTDSIIVQADKNAKHGVVVKVMDAIKISVDRKLNKELADVLISELNMICDGLYSLEIPQGIVTREGIFENPDVRYSSTLIVRINYHGENIDIKLNGCDDE